jgi:hypothetical protein
VTASADALSAGVAALVRAGAAAGLPEEAVRDEAAAFAAALCEATPGASQEWAAALHLPENAFAGSAALGRSWRRQPTALLSGLVQDHNLAAAGYAQALAEIASAACSLGATTMRGAGVASVAAAVQLRSGVQAVAPVGYLPPAIASTPEGLVAQLTTITAPLSVPALPTATSKTAETVKPPIEPAVAPTEPVEDLAKLNAELDGMIGLDNIKADVREQQRLLHNAQIRRAKGLKVPKVTRHLVFVGPPGVGKTVVARLVSRIDRAMGLAAKGQLIETGADGLIAGYEGQTALKTAAKIEEALDGTLFIDEAYKLADSEFGTEAIAVLLKAMEDSRDRLRVIVAGYPDEMESFLDSNPGFAERFYKIMRFMPYTDDELVRIFELDCTYDDYTPTP